MEIDRAVRSGRKSSSDKTGVDQMTPSERRESESSYVSKNVFEGKRPLTTAHAARLREIVDQQTRRPSGKKTVATRSRRAKKQKPV
jgi:hypothetical protein